MSKDEPLERLFQQLVKTMMAKPIDRYLSYSHLAAGAAVAAGLYWSSRYSYLLFHSLVELFCILVAGVVFVLAWNTRTVHDNRYLLFIGIASLAVSALELAHMLAYSGMAIFRGYDANLPTQLWIAFRCLFGLSFLAATFFMNRPLNAGLALSLELLVSAGLLLAIFSGKFPACFVEGRGLTVFKIGSEYIICLLFLSSLFLLLRHQQAFDATVLRLIAAALIASIGCEISFTEYASVFGFANMVGHFFLLASMFLIYRALVVTGIVEPSRILFHRLKQNEEALEARVRERTAELARTNEELEAEISERMHAEEEINQLNRRLEHRVQERTAQLEAANRELHSFAYSVSHDLKAPLRSINGFSEAILGEYGDKFDDTCKDYFRRIRAAAEKMNQLIDGLLNLSRVTRGELKRTEVDLTAIGLDVTQDLRRTEPSRTVDVRVAEGMHTEGDPAMLRSVVENLMGNAWKFTGKREAATIEFGVTQENGAPVYFVRDNGAGFDQAYAGKLFTAFQRLHTVQEFPGIGIGLATVQRIVHRHGGRIWAEGEPGRGAGFYFTVSEKQD